VSAPLPEGTGADPGAEPVVAAVGRGPARVAGDDGGGPPEDDDDRDGAGRPDEAPERVEVPT